MKLLLGVLLMGLSFYGIYFWNHILYSSGGPDLNRNLFQYVLPEFLLAITFAIGAILFWNVLKKMEILNNLKKS